MILVHGDNEGGKFMSHTNYSKMSTNKNTKNSSTKIESKVEKVEEVVESEIIEEVSKPEKCRKGFVSGCKRLNIRKKPNINSDVVCVVDAGTELLIIKSDSTNEWFEVIEADGEKGYCMKKYVKCR